MYKNDAVTRRRTPSFSSSLLDAIYRSIDDPNPARENEFAGVRRPSSQFSAVSSKDLFAEQKRAVVIESWVEKRSASSSVSYSSSDSSSRGGGVFSSSDDSEASSKTRISSILEQKEKSEGGFSKTKLRAKKIYGELKKVKQPISPGGRIASFLNSIFSSGNGKKVKMCSIGAMDDVTTERKSKSACSSVTSFSRSCLSKTPPSRGKSGGSNGGKRSVRFYPVSVIVDEDLRPCGQKSIYEDDPGIITVQKSWKKTDFGNGGRYIGDFQKKKSEFDFRGFRGYEEEDSDDDDESCSSSDLFELDHLIGIGRFREELPVYETTNLKTNQAIASGFIL